MDHLPSGEKWNRQHRTLFIIVSAAIILASIVLSGILIGSDKLAVNMNVRNMSPSFTRPFGTDWLGRDMFSRTIKGLTLSLIVGVLAAFSSACIALVLSLLSSWNRAVDSIITWFIDLFLSVPHIVALILISFAFGGGLKGTVIGIALTHWPRLARLLRAEVLQVLSTEYVQISRRFGKSRLWIARHHLFPHLLPQLFIGFILLFPHAILHEAAITFLGFGLPPEQPAIGIILSESMRYLSTGMWWLAFYPGLTLVFTVWLFDLMGTNLGRLMNPYN